MRRLRQDELAGLTPLLPRLAGVEVVVIGDFVADEYVYGETERISREAPVLIVRHERSELKAGGAGNAAANLASLGVKVRALGVVGEDGDGERLLETLSRAGVDVKGIRALKGRTTEVKTRILAGGRSTRRQQMLRVDRAPEGPVPERAERALLQDLAKAARGADAILASDYGSGCLTPAAIGSLVALSGKGARVCVDSRYNLASFAGVTMVKPNEPELEQATGIRLGTDDALDRAARSLQKQLRCEALLVTRGRHGMSLFRTGSPPAHLAAHGTQEAVDVTGAGDTVIAAFSAAFAAGADALDAARLANVAGSLVVQKPGAATVGREELLAELVAR
jgi:rfaE bifunctional protein kinase chain/domain